MCKMIVYKCVYMIVYICEGGGGRVGRGAEKEENVCFFTVPGKETLWSD